MARSVRWVAIVILTAALAACTSDSKHSNASSTSTTERSFPASAVFKGNAALTGAVDARSRYELDYRSASPKVRTCSQIAATKGPRVNFLVPFPPTVGRYKVTALASASPFKGPGLYGLRDFAQLEVRAAAKGHKTAESYRAKPSSAVRLEVKPDGSGSFTFTGFKSSSGKSLSGSDTWTCSSR